MLRRLSLIARLSGLAALALVLLACGSQEKRPSQDVLLAEQATKHIERLRSEYASMSMSGLEALCSAEAYEAIERDLGKNAHSPSTLEFVPEWVEISVDGTIEVRVGWSGTWTLSGGEEARDKGKAVFVLGGRPMRLQKLKGASPFAAPGAPGASGIVR